MSDDTKIKLLVDVKTRRPGCVLLQAVAGGDSHFVSTVFDTRHWLLAPTENMGMVTGSVTQWKNLAAILDKNPKSK